MALEWMGGAFPCGRGVVGISSHRSNNLPPWSNFFRVPLGMFLGLPSIVLGFVFNGWIVGLLNIVLGMAIATTVARMIVIFRERN